MLTTRRLEGNEAIEKGKYLDGIQIYCEILKEEQDVEEKSKILSNRSFAYYRLNRWREAYEDANMVIALRPNWERGYLRKALALIKMGQSPKQVYVTGFAMCPDSTVLANACKLQEEESLKESPPTTTTHHVTFDDALSPPAPRVQWNEESLATQALQRGVEYGTMKIDYPDTPVLVYDQTMDEEHGKIGTLKDPKQPPEFVDIEELKYKLGILETDCNNNNDSRDTIGASSRFSEERKREIYRDEGNHFKNCGPNP